MATDKEFRRQQTIRLLLEHASQLQELLTEAAQAPGLAPVTEAYETALRAVVNTLNLLVNNPHAAENLEAAVMDMKLKKFLAQNPGTKLFRKSEIPEDLFKYLQRTGKLRKARSTDIAGTPFTNTRGVYVITEEGTRNGRTKRNKTSK